MFPYSSVRFLLPSPVLSDFAVVLLPGIFKGPYAVTGSTTPQQVIQHLCSSRASRELRIKFHFTCKATSSCHIIAIFLHHPSVICHFKSPFSWNGVAPVTGLFQVKPLILQGFTDFRGTTPLKKLLLRANAYTRLRARFMCDTFYPYTY